MQRTTLWVVVVLTVGAALTGCSSGEGVSSAADESSTAGEDADTSPSPATTSPTTKATTETALASGSSTCEADEVPGFAVSAEGTPAGPLPEDRDTQNLARFTEVRLTASRGSYIATFAYDASNLSAPEGEVVYELWLSAADGDATGLIRVHGETGTDESRYEVSVGTSAGALHPSDGAVSLGRDRDKIVIPADELPVLQAPFRWTGLVMDVAARSGDICPSAVDPADPLADAEMLQSFPAA